MFSIKYHPLSIEAKMTELPDNNTPSPANEPNKKVKKTRKKRSISKRVFRFVAWIVASFLALFVIFAFAIQSTSVQNYVIGKTTTFLSKELKTTVRIDNFKLDFFNELSIGGLYIANQNEPNDTLLSSKRLRVDISYRYLLFGIIQLDAIKLENTTVRLKRDIGQYDFNHQYILDYFDPPKKGPSTPKKTIDIRIGQIHLRDVDFSSDDHIEGKHIETRLKAADIHTNIMNLPNRLLDITRINIFDPYFKLEDFQKNPLPPRLVEKPVEEKNITKVMPPVYVKTKDEEKPFQFIVGAISIEGGTFIVDNWRKAPQKLLPDDLLDYQHLTVFDVNIHLHNFFFSKNEVTTVVDGISLRDKSGFVLNKLTVGDAKITSTETQLYGLQIETPKTLLGDTLRFIYPEGFGAFSDFENKVTLDARIHGGQILIDDIMTFAVKLENNPFFVRNRNELASINLRAFGKINSLKLNEFDIMLGKGFHAIGKLGTRDLTNKNETFIDLKLNSLKTDMISLKQLIPGFQVGTEFDRFGKLNFNGEFIGFFNKFSAKGNLDTEIGSAVMNMQLEPANENANIAAYFGDVALDNFNLGALTQNKDLGKISMKASILRGRGLSANNINLNLVALVDNFQFKNYDYKNLSLTGDLNKNLFSGKFESKDPNADLLFNGTVDFASSTPVFNFKSTINSFDLKALNLSKEDLTLSGNINLDLSGNRLSNITGIVDAKNIVIVKNKTQQHRIDSLSIVSTNDADGTKHFKINSEILNAHIDGLFNIEKIPDAFINHLYHNHPRLAADIGIKPKNLTLDMMGIKDLSNLQSFNYSVNILNTKSLTKLFDNKLDTLRNINIEGKLNEINNSMEWSISTDETHYYDNIKIVEFGSIGRSQGTDIDWDLKSYNVVIDGKQDFKDLTFQNHVTGDTVELGFTSYNFSQALRMDTVELNMKLLRQDSFYKLSFVTNQLSRIKIFGDYWNIDNDNYILLGNKSLNIRGFDLRNNDRQITLESCKTRGLSATLNNFEIGFINSFINDRRFTLSGKYLVNVEFDDVFTLTDFRVHASMDTFIVKGKNRGGLRIAAMGKDFKSPIYANVILVNGNERLNIDGYYYPKDTKDFAANSIDVNLNLQSFPFNTLQLLIENGASNFVGQVNGDLKVKGQVKKLDFSGALRLKDVAVTVDYIQSRLHVRDETVRISNTMFDATGSSIYDDMGHRALVYGGLTHNRFLDFGLNVSVRADTFLMLNTKREDNSLYYGTGIGSGFISFTGDFNRTDIKIIAKTGKGTRITFPFASDQTASETGFVVFKKTKNTEGTDTIRKVRELKGINLDMELTLTDQAETTLIFDESSGDNIKARGFGDINLSFNRTGEMKMNGEYRIAQGDYLFTLLKVVNKNFTLKPGGTIRWNGDPFNAIINIDAEYKGLSTTPYNFIAEYVTNDNTESRKPTNVELSLKLSGVLSNPDINFDLAFPRLSSELKSYAENKLRLLRQDQNELNRQVFGLVVFGTFLPADAAFVSNSQIRSGSINTFTETVSNYLSNMFNKLLDEYVTGLDVEIGYNIYEYDKVGTTDLNRLTGQQFRLRGSYNIDDRWTVSAGLGVESGNVLQNNSNVFLGGDILVDYSLSADRRLKLRFSYVRDQVLQGKRDKPAVGIRFRKEFDTFEELVKNIISAKKQDNSVK